MSAQDNLSPQQFFHGTVNKFNQGDELKAGRVDGYKYLAPDISAAQYWAHTLAPHDPGPGGYRAPARVYEVHPEGQIEDDPNSEEDYRTTSKVKVGKEVWHGPVEIGAWEA